MAKRKVSRKYKKKAMMERAMTQERKAPTPKQQESSPYLYCSGPGHYFDICSTAGSI